jgi:hypothetical protein
MVHAMTRKSARQPSAPGIDHPEPDTEAHVALPGSGVPVSSRVESVDGDVLSLRPSVSAFVDAALVCPGAVVEVRWQGSVLQRRLPAEVIAVESGAVLRWQLRITGPAEPIQRREAVRGSVVVPVEVGLWSSPLPGETNDLSEYGATVALDGFGVPPEPGDRLDLRLELECGPVVVTGEVVRVAVHGARWFLSARFLDIPEKVGDSIRRQVFRALREERARLVD